MMQDFEMVMPLGYRITWFGHHGNPHHPYSHCTRMYIPSGQKRPIKPAPYHGMIPHVVCPLSTSATICCTQFGPWTPMHGISYHLPPCLTPLLPLSLHPPLLPSAHHHTDEGAVRQRWWRRWRPHVYCKMAKLGATDAMRQYHWPPFNPSKPG